MRTGFQNRAGVVYDPADLKTLFAQDMQAVADFINNYVPYDLSPYYKIDGSNGPLTNLKTSKNGGVQADVGFGNYAEWLIENLYSGVTDGSRLRLKNGTNIWDIQSEGDNLPSGNDYGLNIIHNGVVVAKFKYIGHGLELVGAVSASNLSNTNTGDETTSTIKSKLGISTLSGANTGDETDTSIKTKLGITTISGSNTGDETTSTIKSKLGISTLSGSNTGDQVGDGTTITGSGTVADPFVAHSAQAHTLETKTTDYNVLLTDKEKTLVMNATTSKAFNLPSVDGSNLGTRYTFVKSNSGQLNIQCADSDTIVDSGAGQKLYNSQTNEDFATVTIELITATKWAIVGACGTWVTTQ